MKLQSDMRVSHHTSLAVLLLKSSRVELSLMAFSLKLWPEKHHTSLIFQLRVSKMFIIAPHGLICCAGQYNYSFYQHVIIVQLLWSLRLSKYSFPP